MRERLKDPGRLLHMLEMAQLLASERERQSLEAIKRDKVLFYGLTKMVEIIGEAAYKITKEFKPKFPIRSAMAVWMYQPPHFFGRRGVGLSVRGNF